MYHFDLDRPSVVVLDISSDEEEECEQQGERDDPEVENVTKEDTRENDVVYINSDDSDDNDSQDPHQDNNATAKYQDYDNPYSELLNEFRPNAWQLESKSEMKSFDLETTMVTLVETEPVLLEMLSSLQQTKEIAFDLRQHNLKVVLQMSTRTEDFLVCLGQNEVMVTSLLSF